LKVRRNAARVKGMVQLLISWGFPVDGKVAKHEWYIGMAERETIWFGGALHLAAESGDAVLVKILLHCARRGRSKWPGLLGEDTTLMLSRYRQCEYRYH